MSTLECLNCGQGNLLHDILDVAYEYKGHATVVPKVAGWHCSHCHEVEFDSGEGKRFAEAINSIAAEIDARAANELARIRKKLKLTQQEAAQITGGGPNAFFSLRARQGSPTACRDKSLSPSGSTPGTAERIAELTLRLRP